MEAGQNSKYLCYYKDLMSYAGLVPMSFAKFQTQKLKNTKNPFKFRNKIKICFKILLIQTL